LNSFRISSVKDGISIVATRIFDSFIHSSIEIGEAVLALRIVKILKNSSIKVGAVVAAIKLFNKNIISNVKYGILIFVRWSKGKPSAYSFVGIGEKLSASRYSSFIKTSFAKIAIKLFVSNYFSRIMRYFLDLFIARPKYTLELSERGYLAKLNERKYALEIKQKFDIGV